MVSRRSGATAAVPASPSITAARLTAPGSGRMSLIVQLGAVVATALEEVGGSSHPDTVVEVSTGLGSASSSSEKECVYQKSKSNSKYPGACGLPYQFVLQDHNYGAPPPPTPPMSPTAIRPSDHDGLSGSRVLSSSLPEAALSGAGVKLEDDEDSRTSVLSSPRHGGVDGEPEEGEETETAPEGEEDEDDSVTRCICNFEHDDGYMICCDKCFVWQHVDCMGIDRSNIPDEYQCERCQPRRVDRTRARALQLRKREELSHHHSDSSSSSTSSSSRSPVPPPAPLYSVSNGPASGIGVDNGEEGVSGRRRRRTSASSSVLMAAARGKTESKRGAMKRKKQESVREPVSGGSGGLTNNSLGKESNNSRSGASQRPLRRRKRRDSIKGAEYKRATAKRRGKAAAKSLGADEVMGDEETQDSWEVGTSGSAGAIQLRRWIDNYEEAVTNHYSPELRARLSAIRVNGIHSGLNSGSNGLGSLNISSHHSSASKCRVTQLEPGIRALVASSYLHSNQIVIEIRGKYMLGTQHRQQSSIAKRYPPFLFFYELPKDGTEVCVDARTYGNAARFIRRSCRPNAEVRHCIEKGVLHLYIVTTSSIEKNAEITILHESHHQQLDAHGHLICACNSKDCTAPAPYKRNGFMETDRDRRRRGRRTVSSEGDNPDPPVAVVATTQPTSQHSITRRGPKSPTKVPVAASAATVPSSSSSSSSFSSTATSASAAVPVTSPLPLPSAPPPQNVQEDSSDATRVDSDHAESSNKKKLTREERKMEAIMKAFERLEKAEQRRQEVLARQAQRKEQDVVTADVGGGGRGSRKEEDAVAAAVAAAAAAVASKRATEEDEEDDDKMDALEMRSERPRRKGRKGRGRLSAPLRRNSRIQSGDGESDLTSADEGPAFPPTTPAAPTEPHSSSTNLSISTSVPSIGPSCSSPTSPSTSWAGESASSPSANPQLSISSLPYGINSIAFAGPLTPGFKFPKTKKVLMNEWLNKGPSESMTVVSGGGQSLAASQSPVPSGGKGEVSSFSTSTVVGLSPSALLPLSAGRESLACALVAAAIGTPLASVSPGSAVASAETTGVGSAKKRWLRQAIRDETDSPAGNICCSPNSRAGSPPCSAGDYVTPLKKRRLARESMSSEQSFTPPTTPLGGCDNDGGNNSSSPPPASKAIPTSEKTAHSSALEEEDYEEEEEEYEEDDEEEYEEDDEEGTPATPPLSHPLPNADEVVSKKEEASQVHPDSAKLEDVGEVGGGGGGRGRRRVVEERSSANGGVGVCCPKGSDDDFVGGHRKNGISHKELGFQDMKESTSQPATKRKLSISEYRKRKLRASGDEKPDSIKSDKDGESPPLPHCGSEVDHISIKEESKLASSILDGLENDRKGCDEKSSELCYTRWNSAPTLVERQRENLTERLKREFGLCVGDEEEQERLKKHLGIADVVDKALGKDLGCEAKLSSRMLVVQNLASAPPPPPPLPPPRSPPPPLLPPPPPPPPQSASPPPTATPSLIVPASIGRPPLPLLKAVPTIPPTVSPAPAYAINGSGGGPVVPYGYQAAAAALPPVSLPPPPPPPPLPPPVQYPPLVPPLPFVPTANSSNSVLAGRPSRAPGQATAHPVASPIMTAPSGGPNNASGNIVVSPSVRTTSKTFFGQGFLPSRT